MMTSNVPKNTGSNLNSPSKSMGGLIDSSTKPKKDNMAEIDDKMNLSGEPPKEDNY
jgi:hypothetical protein